MNKSVTHIKSKAFAIRIVRFYRHMTEVKKEYVLSKQILRSGTSIGANVRESFSAQSKADFISKLSIALKEADETGYWLELLVESDYIDRTEYDSLNNDLKEVAALIAASVKTAKAASKSTDNRVQSTTGSQSTESRVQSTDVSGTKKNV